MERIDINERKSLFERQFICEVIYNSAAAIGELDALKNFHQPVELMEVME